MSSFDVNEGDISFSVIVSLLRVISTVAATKITYEYGQPTKRPSLDKFKLWLHDFRQKYPNPQKGTTAMIFKLLFPRELDTSRNYMLQEAKLGPLIANALGVQDKHLKHWDNSASSGTLGLQVKHVMSQLSTGTKDTLAIRHIDAFLTQLASISQWSDEAIKEKLPNHPNRKRIVRRVYSRLDPDAAAFLTEILLKDLTAILYRVPEGTHWKDALIKYNTRSFYILTKEDAMWAWDPTGLLWKAYRQRANIDWACAAWECNREVKAPQLRIPVAIPKTTKGFSVAQAVHSLRRANETVWAETKYDGERAQIHLERGEGCEPIITMFSKSQRNSTDDRTGVHAIVRDAVFGHTSPGRAKYNVILEAEMVAWNERDNRIDEYWRVRHLVDASAKGPRAKKRKATATMKEDESDDTSSLKSEDGEYRHLALVFFDVLYLDSVSLLNRPFSERRRILEDVIHPEPGFTMLSEHHPIDIRDSTRAQEDMAYLCAKRFGELEEGLVLKADNGEYNDPTSPWVKLKRDYLPGVGDSLQQVLLGAGWHKKRAAGLHVTSDVLTAYYIGAISNQEAMRADPKGRPHFEIHMTAEYGPALSRKGLEDMNFWMKNSGHVHYADIEKYIIPQHKSRAYYAGDASSDLPYNFTLFREQKANPPRLFLKRPLLVDVYGAGFTVSKGHRRYELRFPRLTKVHRNEPWEKAVTAQALHAIAREVCGRDPSDVEAENAAGRIWSSMKLRETVRSAASVARRTKDVYYKMTGNHLKVPANPKRRPISDVEKDERETKAKRVRMNASVSGSGSGLDHHSEVLPLQSIENVVMSGLATPAPSPSKQHGVKGNVPPKRTLDSVKGSTLCHAYPLPKQAQTWGWLKEFTRSYFVHDLYTFLDGTGWRRRDCKALWAERGILFVRKDKLDGVIKIIQDLDSEAKANVVLYSEDRLPIWILDQDDEGLTGEMDVLSRALYVFDA